MDRDALASVGVIALLLVIIVVATVYNNSQQFVARRTQVNTVVSNALDSLLLARDQAQQKEDGTCSEGCIPVATPAPTSNQKQQYQSDPIPYIRDALATKFATQLADGDVESIYSVGTSLYWRSADENYRIKVGGAKTLTLQVPTTEKAYQATPNKKNEAHPAMRHPILQSVQKEVAKVLKKIDFKQSKFADCPVRAAYDPFDNCVATFVKGDMRCSLLAGYGRYGDETISTADPYLHLELSCSDQYDTAYALQSPYLYAINLINPPWATPDLVIEQMATSDGLTWVDFGYTSAYFQDIDGGLRILDSSDLTQSCQVTRTLDSKLQLSCQ